MEYLPILIEIIKQIAALAALVLASGLITSSLTELLKQLPDVDLFSNHPRITAAVISVVLSAFAIFTLGVLSLSTWFDLVIVAGATLFSAMKSYDYVLKSLLEKYEKKSK